MRITARTLALTLLAAGCGGSYRGGPTAPGPVATTSVALRNSAFTPAAIVVAPGATVTFRNDDGVDHNLTFASTAIASVGNFTTGTRTIAMPTTPGTYQYRCTIHAGMTGSVTVE